MKPIEPQGVAAMKERGYEAATIAVAEAQLAHLARGRRVAEAIGKAFRGVRLGDGIGLGQAQGLDDYADTATLARYRESDEKEDWSAIPIERLRRCNSSLAFFDPEGMRFHLPAFLIADLRGLYGFGMAFTLTHLDDYEVSRFAALNTDQRRAVRLFLEHIFDDPEYEFDRDSIQAAIRGFWA